jgi:twinfilin-like protein
MKHRMVYSCGAVGVFKTAGPMLEGSTSVVSTRKIETSDPMELNEGYLKVELGLDQGSVGSAGGSGTTMEEVKPFAKPKGPGRR